jgi:hypothetical protein
MTEDTKTNLDDAFKLRRAICAVADGLQSQYKCMVDQFLRFVSPSMVREYGSNFPYTCRTHNLNAERCSHSGLYPLLYFHIGNAIKAYYDGFHGQTYIQADSFPDRLRLLEEVAIQGLYAFTFDGSDSLGYSLLTLSLAKEILRAKNQLEAEKFKREDAAYALLDQTEAERPHDTGGVPSDGEPGVLPIQYDEDNG